jgi:hypothetical protein
VTGTIPLGVQATSALMKLSELNAGNAPSESSAESLPYPRSELAAPSITAAEALAVDLGRDTTPCRRHGGQFTHLNIDGKAYFCSMGRMYYRHSKQLSELLKPLPYTRVG